MASGNLFLGSASRSVGDVTMYVRNGKQISRVRRRQVSNPRSGLQLAQRCVLKTVSTAYSILAPICGQSFQGQQSRSMNQARFQKLNLDLLRSRAAAALDGEGMTDAGVYENTTGNFVGKQAMGAAINPYIISEGSLHFNAFKYSSEGFGVLTATSISTITYQQFCDLLGVQPGDQITFAVLFSSTEFVGENNEAPYAGYISDFQYARIILTPSDGDMESALFTSSSGTYKINKPNSRNEGSLEFVSDNPSEQTQILLQLINGRELIIDSDEPLTATAACAILSRQTNSGWQYSRSSFEVLSLSIAGVGINDHLPLNAAVASFETSQDSSKYLNQARRVG